MLPLPMLGTIVGVAVESGATAEEGQLVCVIEAMRVGNEITVHEAGTIAGLAIRLRASVASGGTLVVIKPASE